MELRFIENVAEWKSILKEHNITDVYYQPEYTVPMASHFMSNPVLVSFDGGSYGFIYVLLIQDISRDEKFLNLIPDGKYFDAETPYGYGGPYFWGNHIWGDSDKIEFTEKMKAKCVSRGIVSQFIRYYPLIFRDEESTLIVDRFGTYKNTIYMDLTDPDNLDKQLDSQYRRKIRKAKEAGVTIEHDKGENISEFIRLYNMTMNMHDAEDMYYFKENYYDSLIRDFKDNFSVFYAYLDGKVVGSSIFLHDKDFMHFHLGGRDINAPNVPFENMLMVEAARWGAERRLKKLHLGGGLSNEDSLFQYKKKFNRNGMLPFYIGRSIFDDNRFNELMKIRAENDPDFNADNGFYIAYRF